MSVERGKPQHTRARRAVSTALLAVTATSLADCRRHKSDEELLREKIDCIPVHLYVATKVAVLRAPTDPAARNARAQLAEVMRVAEVALRASNARTQAAAEREHPPEQPRPVPPDVSARDLARLVAALWNLRAEGARIVRSGREDELQPILPMLLSGSANVPAWVNTMTLNTEHAVLFLVLLALRLNEKVPVPIPPEMILYEGSRTDAGRLGIEGFESLVRGAKAYVFATNELCDMASVEASAMDRVQWNAAALQRGMSTLSGGHAITERQAQTADLTFRALGHGASAACYARRGNDAQMKEELRRFIESLHSLGVEPEETGVIRALLAHENHDDGAARRALADARRMRDLDDSTRAQIEAMDRALAQQDRGAIKRHFDRGQLAVLTGRVVYRQLARSGAFDELAAQPTFVTIRSYLSATTRTVESAGSTLGSTASDAQSRARGIFGRFRR